MLTRNLGWLFYFGLIALILFMGWSEPLRNRFMAPTKAASPVPHVSVQMPAAVQPKWMSDDQRWDIKAHANDQQDGGFLPGVPQNQR